MRPVITYPPEGGGGAGVRTRICGTQMASGPGLFTLYSLLSFFAAVHDMKIDNKPLSDRSDVERQRHTLRPSRFAATDPLASCLIPQFPRRFSLASAAALR